MATVATVIGMWIVGVPLLLWMEKRHRRKLDEESKVKYREEPGNLTIIGCLGYGLFFIFWFWSSIFC